MDYFLNDADRIKAEAQAIDAGQPISRAVYEATKAMHRAQGSFLDQGFLLLENVDLETEAFMLSNGAVIPLHLRKAAEIKERASKSSGSFAACFEPEGDGPVQRLFPDPEGLAQFRCVEAPGLRLDEAGISLLAQAKEEDAGVQAQADAASRSAELPIASQLAAKAAAWVQQTVEDKAYVAAMAQDSAEDAQIAQLIEQDALRETAYLEAGEVKAFIQAHPKCASLPGWEDSSEAQVLLMYEAARSKARAQGALLCEGEILMRHGGDEAFAMPALLLKDGLVVPFNWEMAAEMPMVPTGFHGHSEGIFFRAAGFTRMGVDAIMDPSRRSHFRVLEAPGLELSPLGEMLLSMKIGAEGTLAEQLARPDSEPRAAPNPSLPDADAFWIENHGLGIEEFQKKYFEESLAHAKAAGILLAVGELAVEELDGSTRRLPAYVEVDGALRAPDLSAATAGIRMLMGSGVSAWFESPQFPDHRGLVFFDQDDCRLVALDTPGASITAEQSEDLKKLTAFLAGGDPADAADAPGSVVSGEAGPGALARRYDDALAGHRADGSFLAAGEFSAVAVDGSQVARMRAHAVRDGSLVGEDPELMREVADLHGCDPKRFRFGPASGQGILFSVDGAPEPYCAIPGLAAPGVFKALEVPGAKLTMSEKGLLAEVSEFRAELAARPASPSMR